MSAGATLLKLQQIDLELARNKSELANMPELKELAPGHLVACHRQNGVERLEREEGSDRG